MAQRPRIAIIGAGLGGLTAGALLAKRGFRITVIEKHFIVGGCATVFQRKGGFTCEVGLHEMDDVYGDPLKRSTFDELGVYGAVSFVEPNEFFSVRFSEDFEFTMPHNKREAIDSLVNVFPNEKSSILKYFDTIAKLAKEYRTLLQGLSFSDKAFFPLRFPTLWRYRNESVLSAFNKLFSNKALQLILDTNIGYYHHKPSELSFIYHAIAQHGYFEGGGAFIKGGSQQLSNHLANVIEAHGGTIYTSAKAVSADSNHVYFVRKGERGQIPYDVLISNLSPMDTYALFGMRSTPAFPIGTSLFTVYLGFSKPLNERYGPQAYSRFFFDGISSLEDQEHMRSKPLAERGFVFVDYSQIASGLTPANKSFGAVVTVDDINSWDKSDKKAYRARKEVLAAAFISRLEQAYPGIAGIVEYKEAATPLTIRRYIGTPGGTPYGFAPLPSRIFRVPRVKSARLKNVYFVGQWVIGGGFSPAIISGKLAADAISGVK